MIIEIPKLALILNSVAKSSKPFLLHCSSSALLLPLSKMAETIGLQVGYGTSLSTRCLDRDHTVIIPHSVSSEVIGQEKNFLHLFYSKFLSKRLKIKCFPTICPGPCAIWAIQWYSGKRTLSMAFAGPIYFWKLYCGIYLSP